MKHIAIVGPGAVGKTTVLSHLQETLDNYKFVKIDERDYLINYDFDNYMNDMKSKAFKTQQSFFAKRYDQIQRMQNEEIAIMDRHLIDDFLFPRVHIKVGNFSKEEAKEWETIEKKYFDLLSKVKKLDLLIILLASDELIESRRESRAKVEAHRKEEPKNKEFFREVNNFYHDEDSIMYKAANMFSDKVIVFKNDNSENTAKKIKISIDQLMS